MENKFNLKPFDKVLVRGGKMREWSADWFSHYSKQENETRGMAAVMGHHYWDEVIPYEGNESLLGTRFDYVDAWQPKDGDFVKIRTKTLETISIINGIEGDGCINTYVDFIMEENLQINRDVVTFAKTRDCSIFCPATEEEKQQLLSKLAEIGKKWNAEKKCVEDVWTPKDGDFVYVKSHYNKYIFIKKEGSRTEKYISLDLYNQRLSDECKRCSDDEDIENIRPATEEEKQQLLDALHKEGKDWDESKKEIVEYKWKPKIGEEYYFINDGLRIQSTIWYNSSLDKERRRVSNVFAFAKEAQAMANKFKDLLKQQQ